MTPDERRQAIISATLPLVLEHGRAITTAQIAKAAKVAEGTIFRVFSTKDDLIDATIESAFDMEPYLRAVEGLDTSGSVDEVVTRTAQLMIERFKQVFRMFSVLGIKGPPPNRHPEDWAERVASAHDRLLGPHADELTLTPREVMRYVRLLAFSGSNPHITDGVTLSAAQIAALVLDGTRRKAT
ncbi:MAG TPA: TetR/AcrR family transcriptional regulator [Phycicoccus sp.]|jgi:AcrR family transcriptional regulator|nr:TetR/AcrR family transcriptional regulator [Phycicoccus sp.]